jgi:hypothetical protein
MGIHFPIERCRRLVAMIEEVHPLELGEIEEIGRVPADGVAERVRPGGLAPNKGAPGVDRQDFADIETYGVERWLGELALALREESYQPDPIRNSVHPEGQLQAQAAGHLDRGGSGLHDSSDAGAGADLRSRSSN